MRAGRALAVRQQRRRVPISTGGIGVSRTTQVSIEEPDDDAMSGSARSRLVDVQDAPGATALAVGGNDRLRERRRCKCLHATRGVLTHWPLTPGRDPRSGNVERKTLPRHYASNSDTV